MSIPELTFRKATEADIDYLLWLREVTMNKHILNSGLPATKEKHIERIRYQYDMAKIILIDTVKIGLLKVSEHTDYTEIVQIQIAPEQQGKGIGRQILESVISESLDKKLPVVLSVLKRNGAINLYKRLGFQIVEETDSSFIMKKATIY